MLSLKSKTTSITGDKLKIEWEIKEFIMFNIKILKIKKKEDIREGKLEINCLSKEICFLGNLFVVFLVVDRFSLVVFQFI